MNTTLKNVGTGFVLVALLLLALLPFAFTRSFTLVAALPAGNSEDADASDMDALTGEVINPDDMVPAIQVIDDSLANAEKAMQTLDAIVYNGVDDPVEAAATALLELVDTYLGVQDALHDPNLVPEQRAMVNDQAGQMSELVHAWDDATGDFTEEQWERLSDSFLTLTGRALPPQGDVKNLFIGP